MMKRCYIALSSSAHEAQGLTELRMDVLEDSVTHITYAIPYARSELIV